MRPQKWSQRCITIDFFKAPQLPVHQNVTSKMLVRCRWFGALWRQQSRLVSSTYQGDGGQAAPRLDESPLISRETQGPLLTSKKIILTLQVVSRWVLHGVATEVRPFLPPETLGSSSVESALQRCSTGRSGSRVLLEWFCTTLHQVQDKMFVFYPKRSNFTLDHIVPVNLSLTPINFLPENCLHSFSTRMAGAEASAGRDPSKTSG